MGKKSLQIFVKIDHSYQFPKLVADFTPYVIIQTQKKFVLVGTLESLIIVPVLWKKKPPKSLAVRTFFAVLLPIIQKFELLQ